MKYLRVDLKVCEGCGGLWLRGYERAKKKKGVYCRSCALRFAEFPAPRYSRRGVKRAASVSGTGEG